MDAPLRRTDPSVEEVLLERPWEFEFFQAVRLLGLIYPERRLLARLGQPPEEVVRFHALLSMSFPASPIYDLKPDAREGGPLHMIVTFMGLTGPMAALPSHYTEYLIARSYSKDNTAAVFFDLFNHRLVSLFYLAWEKHHFAIAYEREKRRNAKARRFTEYLFDLIGMGTPGLRDRLGFDGEALLLYAGLIAQRPHSAEALAGLLRDYFREQVEIEQFVGKWYTLDEQNLSYMDPEGPHNQLGFGAIAGDQVWNQQARFRIRVGPLTMERYNAFLPDGSAFRELVDLARYFVNNSLDFDVQLVLRKQEVPWGRLTDEPGAGRLGWSSWLKTEDFVKDAGDAVLPRE